MPRISAWLPKVRTAAAMARLCWAQFLVNWIAFNRWRDGLGHVEQAVRSTDLAVARRLVADVQWAATRLPIPAKCLPRAMALSWMLRGKRINHAVVIAVRPDQLRQSPDALHAWVEIGGEMILGDLPGPWIETVRLGGQATEATSTRAAVG